MGIYSQQHLQCERFLFEARWSATARSEAEPVWRFDRRPDQAEQDLFLWGLPGNDRCEWPGRRAESHPAPADLGPFGGDAGSAVLSSGAPERPGSTRYGVSH